MHPERLKLCLFECNKANLHTFNNTFVSYVMLIITAFCAENTDYCNNRGNCRDTGRRTAECICNADFSGDRCETKQSKWMLRKSLLGV